ncbi:MAG: replicative DNA helicase [Phycisphaera sp.]|nr:replicative DNA helicase [Phycisphaera sp.]
MDCHLLPHCNRRSSTPRFLFKYTRTLRIMENRRYRQELHKSTPTARRVVTPLKPRRTEAIRGPMTTARTRPNFDVDRGEMGRLFDKLPPHSIEAEMSLLGSMILAGTDNIHLLGEVMQVVRSESDFYLPKHAQIYQALIAQYDVHQSIDLVQLQTKLRDRGQFDAIGGIDYLIELAESVPTAVNAPHYARIVRDKAKLRRLIDAAGHILKDAHEADEDPNHVIDQAEKLIFDIAQSAEADEPETLHELVQLAFEQLEARHESGRSITGISTGFYQLDEMLSGLQPGEMIILAARPSMGKTAFALNIAEYIAVDNKQPVAMFSLEMSKQQLAERLMSSRSGVDSQRMRRNMLNGDEFRRLQEVADEMTEAPMHIDDTPGLSVLQLRAKSRRLASRFNIKAIVIDYLQLMSYPGAESRQNEVGAISRGVKALARELNVPVVCLAQLNRNPEGRESKRPMLSDLRESGSIEQDADVVMMLHREEYYHKDTDWAHDNPDKVGTAEVVIAKQRNGPTGIVNLQFDGATTRFHNLARGSAADGAHY